MQQFHLKTDIKFGPNALDFLGEIQGEKVFIVTDPFMVESKMIDQITSHLGGGSFLVFSEIVPDPPVEVVTRGMAALLKYQPDVVLAFGGGSAIDSAKAILFFSQKSGKMGPARFIAVPTTSGTGSEVTAFAVITDKDKGTKYPLVSDDMVPDIAILDASLVKTLPSSVVADTGMDVITHAIEAYVSTCATDFSDAFAEKAVAMAFSYLPRSFQNREDGEAKEKMHTASCLAGISFQLASLGLNHAIAHNVGARLHIPHGRINAMLLPYVIEFNAGLADEDASPACQAAAKKYARLAQLIGAGGMSVRSGVKNFVREIMKLEKALNMPQSFASCGANPTRQDKVVIARFALSDGCFATTPRKASESQVVDILNKLDAAGR